MKPIALIALIAGLLLAACGGRESADKPPAAQATGGQPSGAAVTEARMVLNWFPEMEHGGFYAAQQEGLYAKGGVEMEIIPGGAGTQVVPQVATGRVEFGVINADNLVLARAEGIPIVALLAPIQISPRCIIVHESSGITQLQELRDTTLAMNITNAFALYLQKHAPLTGVTIVPYSGNTAQFLIEPRYAQQGYIFSEPYIIRQKGGDPRSLMLADIGFNPYTSILVTSEEMLARQPDVVRAVVDGAARGWLSYFKNPKPVNEHLNMLNPEMGLDVLEYGVETLRSLSLTSDTQTMGFGQMTAERWTTLITQMEQIGMIPTGKVTAAEAYRADFIPMLKPE